MQLATREQICPDYPGGAPSAGGQSTPFPGDQWVAFAGDPDGVDNAWMEVGAERPTLTCHTHHNGQDGHDTPPGWGEDGNVHPWMKWVLCADIADTEHHHDVHCDPGTFKVSHQHYTGVRSDCARIVAVISHHCRCKTISKFPFDEYILTDIFAPARD